MESPVIQYKVQAEGVRLLLFCCLALFLFHTLFQCRDVFFLLVLSEEFSL